MRVRRNCKHPHRRRSVNLPELKPTAVTFCFIVILLISSSPVEGLVLSERPPAPRLKAVLKRIRSWLQRN